MNYFFNSGLHESKAAKPETTMEYFTPFSHRVNISQARSAVKTYGCGLSLDHNGVL